MSHRREERNCETAPWSLIPRLVNGHTFNLSTLPIYVAYNRHLPAIDRRRHLLRREVFRGRRLQCDSTGKGTKLSHLTHPSKVSQLLKEQIARTGYLLMSYFPTPRNRGFVIGSNWTRTRTRRRCQIPHQRYHTLWKESNETRTRS